MSLSDLSKQIEERYLQYLKTTFYFADPALRASFAETLKSGSLSKGPYLEATPVFRRGQTPRSLFANLLNSAPDEGLLGATHAKRPLYQHQEEAIQKSFSGRNVIIATGTGSGKTEAFVYPILLHLYREFEAGELCPGVRALILYPMNALANDQRERLGAISQSLESGKSPFRFTFGRYIGETPENENDSYRHARDHMSRRFPGELVLRSEIRETPPNILLTNYSMLEYLLLRPDDSPLFDNECARWWTFIVLDEAHQYRGSRGIEMAMLLRRLKCRLNEGGRVEPFCCIATSATLAGGHEDKAAVATFASNLLGEEFAEEDVILGESEPIPEPGENKLSLKDYRLLKQTIKKKSSESRDRVAELAAKLDLSLSEIDEVPQAIGRILQEDYRASSLRRLITNNPTEVQELADYLFDDLAEDERVTALSELVELLLQAKDPISSAPMLSTRYHLFLRSLEGAFLSYWPQNGIFLSRGQEEHEGMMFEVALCRECGQHYLVGKMRGGKLTEAIRDPGHPDFGAAFFRPIGDDEKSEDEQNAKDTKKEIFRLCVLCGTMWRTNSEPSCSACGKQNSILVEKQKEAGEREDQIPRCSACGYRGRDPVREVIHGTDGPHAVIATSLYHILPETRKKILAFADGRQEAAFFAWYLENSYRDILSRNSVLKVAESLRLHAPGGLSIRELALGLRGLFQERKVFPPSIGVIELSREAWLNVYREFLTDERRISLEGVGLAQWVIKWPDWINIPKLLENEPWSLVENEAWDLLHILIDSMRSDRAVGLKTEDGVSFAWHDLGLQAAQMRVRIGQPRGARRIRSWDGKRGKRAQFLAKLLTRIGLSEKKAVDVAIHTLREIWQTFIESEQPIPSKDRLLTQADDARMLNPDWWRLRIIPKEDTIFQCNVCSRLQSISIRGVCVRHGCPGKLYELCLKELEPNHYRILYEEDFPGSLRVEEHTAQLDKERAREFQREFKNGNIHVLSCSTTFELGVDLGDLDTIFLRNVPPEAFNYVQRVGRAGRRSGYPGFAVTYCKRSPHDLYHFSEPLRMLAGKTRPPVLALHNEKILTRHIVATALSAFFRAFPERFKTAEGFFKDVAEPCGVSDFMAFLQNRRSKMEPTLHAMLPASSFGLLGLEDGTWISRVAGDESRLSDAEASIRGDYATVKRLVQTAVEEEDFDTAKWAKMRAKTIAGEDVLSFLSRKAVIPKYGFPVDVVELDTQRTQRSYDAMGVTLQRDLSMAIAEFAPTSKLIANKGIWTSYGLKKVPEKEWDRRWYARCSKHNLFERQVWSGERAPPSFNRCCPSMVISQYVQPKFGFTTSRDKPEVPRGRPTRVFSTRPYFAGFKDRKGDKISLNLVTLTTVSPGYMVVLCEGRRGRGFYVCGKCGAGFGKLEKNHKTPYGQDCNGTLQQVSLGHEFVTDVLQLQFHFKLEEAIEPLWFAYSLAFALIEGAAEALEVPSTDLSASVAHGEKHQVPPIILYDNVPGGAGLVARLEEKQMLLECFDSALQRVERCTGCAEDSSCYSCLRSYRNQFAHQQLQRGPVAHYLKEVLRNWQ